MKVTIELDEVVDFIQTIEQRYAERQDALLQKIDSLSRSMQRIEEYICGEIPSSGENEIAASKPVKPAAQELGPKDNVVPEVVTPANQNHVSRIEVGTGDMTTGSQQCSSVVSSEQQFLVEEDRSEKEHFFYGSPQGGGFEKSYELSANDSRALYVLVVDEPGKAHFYPIPDKWSRLKINATSLLHPVCNIVGNFTAAKDVVVNKEDYGHLSLENGYWVVDRKCILNCKV